MHAIYCRVSSKTQKTDSQEAAELTRWLEGQGLAPEGVRWYRDTESGRTMARPGFDQMQRAIFAGEIKTVVVWKLDRLARRLRDGINVLGDWCDRGCRVVSVTQQIDLSGALGGMIAAVLLGLAEIEWEYRRERQAAGIALAKSRGVYKGRKPGTRKGKPERAAELRGRGLRAGEIGAALGISERTARRYLAVPSLCRRCLRVGKAACPACLALA